MSNDLPVLNDPRDSKAAPPRPIRVWVAVGVVLFVAIAVYLIVSRGPGIGEARRLPASFQFDIAQQLTVDPALIGYRLDKQISLPFAQARAFAIGGQEEIYVAGPQAVYLLNQDGRIQRSISVSSEPACLAVGDAEHAWPGRLYVASTRGVEVFDRQGERVANWPPPNGKTVFTSIAVAERDLFFADAGNRVVWRYNADGEQIARLDLMDASRPEQNGFAVPGSQFDVVIAGEGLLYVANPGKLQIASLTFDGEFGGAWGKASTSIEGFFGCCNPTHLAVLPDGRVVTCEKGIPRVKVYRPTGELDAVVAGHAQLGVDGQSIGDPRLSEQQANFEIAVDPSGRVLVLDPANRSIRVFVSTVETADAGVSK